MFGLKLGVFKSDTVDSLAVASENDSQFVLLGLLFLLVICLKTGKINTGTPCHSVWEL